MSTPHISPLRKPRPLTPCHSSSTQGVLNSLKQNQLKQKNVSVLKAELKSSKEFLLKQKAADLLKAKEKIRAVKSNKRLEKSKAFKTFSISFPREVKGITLKHHFQWISEAEKRMKTMEEQENKLILEISKACGVNLKPSKGSLTSRSNM
jgi:hypothetical protein